MKKSLLLGIMLFSAFCMNAQTVITGWTFPVNSGPDSLNANLGLTGNLGYDIRFEGTDTTYDVIYFATGASDYAAAAQGWDNGADEKYWSAKFKAADYTNFKVSSKQYSSPDGPRDFKIQWKISGGSFADVPGGTVAVGNDWTSGIVTALPVPITGQGTSSIYLRWLMSSNASVNGGTVALTGETRIDDILVTAVSSTGENEILFTNRLSLSPNPNHGRFTVHSTVALKEVRLTDLNGKTVFNASDCGTSLVIGLQEPKAGTYLLNVKFEDQDRWCAKKVVVE